MLADSEFTQKSGLGTSMFSRPGKFTTFQYLCFSSSNGESIDPNTIGTQNTTQKQHNKQQNNKLSQNYQQQMQKSIQQNEGTALNIMMNKSNTNTASSKQNLISPKANQSDIKTIDNYNLDQDQITTKMLEIQKLQRQQQEFEQALNQKQNQRTQSLTQNNRLQLKRQLNQQQTQSKGDYSFQSVSRENAAISIFKRKDDTRENLFKYNPKFELIDKKQIVEFKFDYGVKGVPTDKSDVKICNRLQKLCVKLEEENEVNKSGQGTSRDIQHAMKHQQQNIKKQSQLNLSVDQAANNQQSISFSQQENTKANNSGISSLRNTLQYSSYNTTKNNKFVQSMKTTSNNQETLFKLSKFLSESQDNSLERNIMNHRTGESKGFCLIDLNKKRNRDFYYDHISGPHEARFENINKMPNALTNSKYVSSPDFKRYTKRKPFIESSKPGTKDYSDKEKNEQGYNPGDPQYDVQAENNKKSLSLGIPDFTKLRYQRFDYDQNKKNFHIPDHYDQDSILKASDKQSTFKKPFQQIGFDKMLPRDDKMFFINEGNNLKLKEDSILEKLQYMDLYPPRRIALQDGSALTIGGRTHSYAGSLNKEKSQIKYTHSNQNSFSLMSGTAAVNNQVDSSIPPLLNFNLNKTNDKHKDNNDKQKQVQNNVITKKQVQHSKMKRMSLEQKILGGFFRSSSGIDDDPDN
eukprot:403363907